MSEVAQAAAVERAGAELDVCGTSTSAPANAEDIARAIDASALEEDWFASLRLPNGDVMEASLDAAGEPFTLDVESGRDYLQAVSAVDLPQLKAILASFLAGDDQWRSLASWRAPPPRRPADVKADKWKPALAVIPVTAIGLVMFNAAWGAALILLLLPVGLTAVILLKMREVKRASGWTRATARNLRSEVTYVTRDERKLSRPQVDYEFPVTFDKFRGNRISIGEIIDGSPEVEAALRRYPVGANVPVYYNPANPRESVLERDLPEKFGAIWILVAGVAAACLSGAWWLVMHGG
jgi:hypothetical protein